MRTHFIFHVAMGAFALAYAASPRHVILMISDGCGYNQIAAANLYATGQAKAQPYESFPVAMPMSTWSATGQTYEGAQAAKDATWVLLKPTDSAASGTAFATGVKTYDAAIGMDMEKNPLFNLSQQAQAHGKSSGVVTTVPISHATPAAFIAHNDSRKDYEGIARDMILNGSAEVILGAGHPYFDHDGRTADLADYRYVGGPKLWADLVRGEAQNLEGKWTLVDRKGAFDSLAAGLLPMPERIVGIAPVRETLQEKRAHGGDAALDQVGSVPKVANVPDLPTLSRVALRALGRDTAGFFLMIEGGAIDWAGHDNHLARSIEEEMDFNASVQAVINWIEQNGGWEQNLLVVTGDHETGYLTGPGGVDSAKGSVDYALRGQGKGKLPAGKYNSKDHSNQLVPLFAKGAGSERIAQAKAGEDPVRGSYTDNARVGQVLMELLGE